MSGPRTATPATMRAMRLERPGQALRALRLPVPQPGPGQILLRVEACGVCRTDLHLIDGELPDPVLPMIPGHEIVGRVLSCGLGADPALRGQRVGVPWLGRACGRCAYCRDGRENLCDAPEFTGYTRDGGFATHAVADAAFLVRLGDVDDPIATAPLLCAGLIGHRALRMAGDARRLGLYGFGAAAHIVAQVAVWEGREVFAFTRRGDAASQGFARSLGCAWAGASDEEAPVPLDAAILFAPVGALVPAALRAVDRGGTVVCAGIHMSDIPSFPYSILWQERVVRSVANLTRRDGEEFLALAPRVPVRVAAEALPLEQAPQALARLRAGEVEGALVLVP